jgi:hypothetical protein
MGARKFHTGKTGAWHEVCICLPKDNAMSAKEVSYFVFHINNPGDDPLPKPGPEWPPVEPTPTPPTTDPVPTVPPVTGFHFPFFPHLLN